MKITLAELEALTGRKFSLEVHQRINQVTTELEYSAFIKPANNNNWCLVGADKDKESAERKACEKVLEIFTRMSCCL